MRFAIDVHLHSRYARATSRDLNPENLHRWSALKGIAVVGTGDYTHPAWIAELEEKLEPAEAGLYRLKAAWRDPIDAELPPSCRAPVRFLLSVEISSIYKKNGRTRKIHNVVILPDFAAASELNRRLGAIGNLKADGRPILGLDSRDLLEICLEVCPEVLFIPAHIWTPHFAALGASSGFDSLEECFEDLLPHIFAVETGLSSDPPMNERLSALDRYAIVSNSDAHSPQKLGREATCFDTELSYPAICAALRQRDPARFTGTLEFYPQEGKYHYDGHRKCAVCWKPAQTLAAAGLCPVCGRKLTVGVLHRVEKLADRPEGEGPAERQSFEYLIPLAEVIAAAVGVGPQSKTVRRIYDKLLAALGPELTILRSASAAAIAACGENLVAEGVRRMRAGSVDILPGYDGEYGKVRLFSDLEREQLRGQTLLFAMPPNAGESAPAQPSAPTKPAPAAADTGESAQDGVDAAQRRAIEAAGGPVLVVAGPGAGKTRVLTRRIDYLVRRQGKSPAQILALTFTNRAAAEMRQRLQPLLQGVAGLEQMRVGTFHRVALELLRHHQPQKKRVLDEVEARAVLAALVEEKALSLRPAAAQQALSLAKAAGQKPGDIEEDELQLLYNAYRERLGAYAACDYDDILLDLLDLLQEDTAVLVALQRRFTDVLVDEFQDLNAVQYRLVRLLAGRGAGLFAIGDPDQAIYGFRGADPGYFAQLESDYAAIVKVVLEKNYRSSGTLVRAASTLIGHNPGRTLRPFEAVRPQGLQIRLLSTPGATAEGIAVVHEISRMVGGADMLQADRTGGRERARSFGDFAVLFRTGRQAEVLEECFAQEGLPYRLSGQKGFLQTPSVAAALAFCRYLRQPEDELCLLQVLELEAFKPAPAAAMEKLEVLEKARSRYEHLSRTEGPAAMLHAWRQEYGPGEDIDLEHLIRLAAEASSLEHLLDTVLLGLEADFARTGGRAGKRAEAVNLLTLHAAKGLEFPVVFICGLEDGLIPLREHGADLEEERRLFYVGLTRAREEAILLHARSRSRYGQVVRPALSPLVAEIPSPLLACEELQPPRPRERAQQLSLF